MDNYKRREFIKLSAIGFAGIALQFHTISAYAQQANGYFGKWDTIDRSSTRAGDQEDVVLAEIGRWSLITER